LLGCGGFGAVELVEHSETQETFALKKLSKGHIVQQGMQQSVINEKSIMFMTNSNFIVKLYATFNTSQSLCFLMEVALGGELYATYNVHSFWGSERHAKYYLAGVALAFEHLHERFVLYRDLKPENVLLNSEGRPKLTDMGLAKFAIEKTYTTCGTPDYFAPEVISTSGQTCAVDWWTLGIMTYELMCGRPPFEAPTPLQTYAKVLKGISKVTFPPRCQGAVADLVRSILKRDPADRLPMRPGKTTNVKQHKWYNGFCWEEFASFTMEPPYKPEVKSASDIANFSASKEDMPPQIHYTDDGSGWDADFAS
jgi:cGMP-dependent protein kinase